MSLNLNGALSNLTFVGPPIWKSDSIHAGGIKNDFELSSSSSRIHLYDDYLIKYPMLLFYILLRYM